MSERTYTESEVKKLLQEGTRFALELTYKQANEAKDDLAALRADIDQVAAQWREVIQLQARELDVFKARCDDLTKENMLLALEVESRVRNGL